MTTDETAIARVKELALKHKTIRDTVGAAYVDLCEQWQEALMEGDTDRTYWDQRFNALDFSGIETSLKELVDFCESLV